MKKRLLLSLAIASVFISPAMAQLKTPVKKIHAYKQASIPGILPVVTDESGNKIREERKPSYNYWFYVETQKAEKITIADLWISGKRFSAKTETVNQLPLKKIIHTGIPGNDTVVLVPYTRNKVILTYPSGQLKDPARASKYLSGLIRVNELVIGYFWKGKKYFSGLKTMVSLEPDLRQ